MRGCQDHVTARVHLGPVERPMADRGELWAAVLLGQDALPLQSIVSEVATKQAISTLL